MHSPLARGCALALTIFAGAAATPALAQVEAERRAGIPITLDRVDTLIVDLRGNILLDTSGKHLDAMQASRALRNLPPLPEPLPEPLGGPAGEYEPRLDCPQTSSHTTTSFEGGSYVVQAGFVQNESAGASYQLGVGSLPAILRQSEMIFATSGALTQTVTQWCWTVYAGNPGSSAIIAEFCSDDVILPHIRVGPGTAGVNVIVQIDPSDPEQIILPDNATRTFAIAYTVTRHNAQSGNGCNPPPPSNLNAFPVTDTNGLQFGSRNWIEAIDCGLGFLCPPGWNSFASYPSFCRPSGDWVMRATWDPIDCPGAPGACCTATGGCVSTDRATCLAFGGTYRGSGTTCADLNGNGIADICDTTPPCPCDSDYDNSGSNIPDLDDLLAFFADFNAGAPAADVNCTGPGSVPDVDDLLSFFDTFTNGC